MTTPTPRTNALFTVKNIGPATKDSVTITDLYNEFVRLERELADAQSELERVRDKCNEHYIALAAAQEARQRAEARAERYLEILREVDGLIKYQYSGSREAMSYLQHIANRVFAALKGDR